MYNEKVRITIYIEQDIINFFKEQSKKPDPNRHWSDRRGYQPMMNNVLRQHMHVVQEKEKKQKPKGKGRR